MGIMDTVTDQPSPATRPELRRAYGSHVSRVLGKAGFERGTVESSSLGNMNYYSPGFEVKGCNQSREEGLLNDDERDAGYVTVQRINIDTHRQEKDDRPLAEKVPEAMHSYATALEAAGFDVEVRREGVSMHLVVLGRH